MSCCRSAGAGGTRCSPTIGRLDADTSGLLLLTDDGALLHSVISPRRHVTKRYLATLDRPLEGPEGAVFAGRRPGPGGRDRTAGGGCPRSHLSATHAYLTVTEGRYHQVRRMFAAVGNHVVACTATGGGTGPAGGARPGRVRDRLARSPRGPLSDSRRRSVTAARAPDTQGDSIRSGIDGPDPYRQ